MRVFVDTNILLDVIESRAGLVEESSAVLARAEALNAKLFIAWHSLTTIYYLNQTQPFRTSRHDGSRSDSRMG